MSFEINLKLIFNFLNNDLLVGSYENTELALYFVDERISDIISVISYYASFSVCLGEKNRQKKFGGKI